MDLEQRLAALEHTVEELKQLLSQQHGLSHELAGDDVVRPSIQNGGTQLSRQRTLNFSTSLTASESTANKRIDVILADHDHTGDTGDGAKLDHGAALSGLTHDDHPQYLLLAGETTDAKLHTGADLIVYSDAGTTEKARIDGATGNITTAGTVDGVDIAARDHAKYTNGEAITAVEGEATLALSGAVAVTGILTVDVGNEKTAGAGMTFEQVLLKDGEVKLGAVEFGEATGSKLLSNGLYFYRQGVVYFQMGTAAIWDWIAEDGGDDFRMKLYEVGGLELYEDSATPVKIFDVSDAGVLNIIGSYQVDAVQVVGNRVVDARCDDAIDSGDATTDGVIDALRDAMITHGLIAAA